ncbi:MAG: hypothetical protein R6U32_07310 [Candidatus Woesearchaeota archaeon]
MEINLIGFHARSINGLARSASIPGVSLVEIKPAEIRKHNNISPYDFDGRRFSIDHDFSSRVRDICGDLAIQLHVPSDKYLGGDSDQSLWQADPKDHGLIMERLFMIEKLRSDYGIGVNVTMHPPAFRYHGADVFSEEEALETGKELYAGIDKLLREGELGYQLNIENTLPVKRRMVGSLGYSSRNIIALLEGTEMIGITYDSGHAILSGLDPEDLFRTGRVRNIHLHSNNGIMHQDDHDDDQHFLATKDNLQTYDWHIERLRETGAPIVLEIKKMKGYEAELTRYVENLSQELACRK